jgi:hypothetical protein
VTPQASPVPSGSSRPEDVDTGFWLWVAALPLMLAGYVCDVVTSPVASPFVIAVNAIFVVVLATVVVTFLVLMRAGYRWARTVLTAGAIASIVYTVSALLTVQRPTVPALIYAGSVIVGGVLLAGGVVLLHRSNAHAYFTR